MKYKTANEKLWLTYEQWLFNEFYVRGGGHNMNPDNVNELNKAFEAWKIINKIGNE